MYLLAHLQDTGLLLNDNRTLCRGTFVYTVVLSCLSGLCFSVLSVITIFNSGFHTITYFMKNRNVLRFASTWVYSYFCGSLLIFLVFCVVSLSSFCIFCRMCPMSLYCPLLIAPSVLTNIYSFTTISLLCFAILFITLFFLLSNV